MNETVRFKICHYDAYTACLMRGLLAELQQKL